MTYPSSSFNVSLTADALLDNSTTATAVTAGPVKWGAVALVLIVFATAFGNILLCAAVITEQQLQNMTNYFLASLAVSDLLVAVVVMPLAVVVQVYDGYFPLGAKMCIVWATMDVLMCTASIWHMATISVDRYCSLRFPLRYRRTRTPLFCIAKIAFVWVVSVLICCPLAIAGFINPLNVYRDGQCAPAVPKFAICGSIFAFFVPLVLMLVTYSLTARSLTEYVAWKRDSRLSGHLGGAQLQRAQTDHDHDGDSRVVSAASMSASSISDFSKAQYAEWKQKESPLLGEAQLQFAQTDYDSDAEVVSAASLTASAISKAHETPGEPFDDETRNNHSRRIRWTTWPQRLAKQFARHDPEGKGKGKEPPRRVHVSSTPITTLEDTTSTSHANVENARAEKMSDSKATKPQLMSEILLDSRPISDVSLQAKCGGTSARSAAATGCEMQKNDNKNDDDDGDDDWRQRQHPIGCRRNVHYQYDDSQRPNPTTLRSTTENLDKNAARLPNDHHHPAGINTLPSGVGHQRQEPGRVSFATQTRLQKRKATRVLGVIFVAFMVMWTPFFVLNILSAVCPHCVKSVSLSVWTVLVWFGWMSSLANPIIYTSFSPAFRSAFRRLLTGHCSHRNSLSEAKRRQQQWMALLRQDNRTRHY